MNLYFVNSANKNYYHFPLLEVDGDLVNAHPPLDTILTITDQREILLDSPIRGLENVLNKATVHLVCCEGFECVVVKRSPSIEDYSWKIEKGAKKNIWCN